MRIILDTDGLSNEALIILYRLFDFACEAVAFEDEHACMQAFETIAEAIQDRFPDLDENIVNSSFRIAEHKCVDVLESMFKTIHPERELPVYIAMFKGERSIQ